MIQFFCLIFEPSPKLLFKKKSSLVRVSLQEIDDSPHIEGVGLD